MSSLSHKNKGNDLVKKYQTHLEEQIGKGDRSLVCRDEKLYKEVKELLTKGNAQKILNQCGLESLTVMENSLQAFPFKTGHLGLTKISNAFEVLELTALNLYLYPWRKEYKSVKMFSGVFTHFIKPALTLQQAKELFGLLGYQPARHNEEEELTLDSKLLPADFIVCLACAFFTARIECQLLISTLGSLDTSVKSALQLVKERQKGHNLFLALDNTKRRLEASHASDTKLTGATEPELDLYTDENFPKACVSHMTSTSSSPPCSSYMQLSNKSPNRDLSQPDRLNNEDTSPERALCALMLQCHLSNPKKHDLLSQNLEPMESNGEEQMAADNQRQTADGGGLCSCITQSLFSIFHCEQCNNIHSKSCTYYNNCITKGHTLCEVQQQQKTNVPLPIIEDQLKEGLKKHHCMINSTSDTFLVCYNCQFIHDWSCEKVKACESHQHNLQPTGVLQPPQEVNAPKRHVCLVSEAPIYIICRTCNSAHDFFCSYVQTCTAQQHDMLHHQELDETQNTPMQFHHCCVFQQRSPETACLTCKMFHLTKCTDGWQCLRMHKTYNLKTICVTCSSLDIYTVCGYCCLMYCRDCLYKNCMSCKCGKLFRLFSSSV